MTEDNSTQMIQYIISNRYKGVKEGIYPRLDRDDNRKWCPINANSDRESKYSGQIHGIPRKLSHHPESSQ